MDPNATLAAIRRLIDRAQELLRTEWYLSDEYIGTLEAIAEHCEALDDWMCHGGFPPTDWSTEEYRLTAEEKQKALDSAETLRRKLENGPGKVHDMSSPHWSIADLD